MNKLKEYSKVILITISIIVVIVLIFLNRNNISKYQKLLEKMIKRRKVKIDNINKDNEKLKEKELSLKEEEKKIREDIKRIKESKNNVFPPNNKTKKDVIMEAFKRASK